MPGAQRKESFTTLSIGEVLSILKKDFPEVSISKIRFLETEGLVTPARTASGYRRFTADDVDRLRAVLIMQRDQYLPLKVIRESLEASAEPATVSAAGVGFNAADFRAGAGRVRLSRMELSEQAGVSDAEIAELERIGIVWRNPAGHYDEDSLSICLIAARLRGFGMDARHLKTFRVVTDRESGLIEQMATPFTASKDRDGRAREKEAIREIASLIIQLHGALLRAELVRSGRV